MTTETRRAGGVIPLFAHAYHVCLACHVTFVTVRRELNRELNIESKQGANARHGFLHFRRVAIKLSPMTATRRMTILTDGTNDPNTAKTAIACCGIAQKKSSPYSIGRRPAKRAKRFLASVAIFHALVRWPRLPGRTRC